MLGVQKTKMGPIGVRQLAWNVDIKHAKKQKISKQKKCLTIVGSEDTFQEMIKNKNEQERYTSLDERIQEF